MDQCFVVAADLIHSMAVERLVERAMPDKSILPTIAGFGIMVVLIVIGLICMGS
jgi:hypothetical protein